ncbi:helix-turn-helix domain-containing protein [Microbacterium oryzae]|uniref:helix-turn-helix domain-containing protein n=1 Tax=Microbacterium oryzae TaxID=743009 RepID=UPI0025B2808F|nr:helix-turn-helix domain-containing protein [Microbacterium oryzae]MDN3309575.1 helix-turn-helix domain-containing protein [Microbacterium oryzae]
MADGIPGWLSVEEAAERVGKDKQTIRRWRREGKLRTLHGLIHADTLVQVDAEQRDRQHGPKKRVHMDLVIDGVKVGTVAFNPETGGLTGTVRKGALDAR